MLANDRYLSLRAWRFIHIDTTYWLCPVEDLYPYYHYISYWTHYTHPLTRDQTFSSSRKGLVVACKALNPHGHQQIGNQLFESSQERAPPVRINSWSAVKHKDVYWSSDRHWFAASQIRSPALCIISFLWDQELSSLSPNWPRPW